MISRKCFYWFSCVVLGTTLLTTVLVGVDSIYSQYDELPYDTSSIILEFSSPIVSMGEYENMIKEVSNKVFLEFSPSIAYRWNYISTSKFEIVFLEEPRRFYPYSLKVKNANLIRGLKGESVSMKVNGKRVFDEYRFIVGGIEVVEIYEKDRGTNTSLVISFNTVPDIEDVREKVSVISGNAVVRNFTVEYLGGSRKSVLVSLRGLRSNRVYKLILERGVRVEGSPVKTKNRYEYVFKTPPEFRVVRVTTEEDIYRQSQYLVIEFNNNLGDNDLMNAIDISPKVENIDIVVDYSNIYLYGDFSVNKEYLVTIGSNIVDEYNQALGKVFEKKVYIDEVIYSYFSSPYGAFVLENYLPLVIPTRVRNLKKIEIRYTYAGDLKSIARILSGDKELKSRYLINLEKLKLDKKVFYQYQVDLEKVLGMDKDKISGLFVYEMVGEPYYYPFDKHHLVKGGVVLITSLGITVKKSPYRTVVFVRKLRDNEPVGEAEVYGVDGEGELEFFGKTDSKGILTVKVDGHKYKWFIAKKGRDVTLDIGRQGFEDYYSVFGYYGGAGYGGLDDFTLEEGVEHYASSYSVGEVKALVFTEKYLYKPGEKVYVKGIVRARVDDTWKIISNTNVYLKILDSRDDVVTNIRLKVDDAGTFHFVLEIDKNAPTGYYTITSENLNIYETFRVEDFKPAIAEIEILLKKNRFLWGEKFEADAIATYLFGAPVKGKVLFKAQVSPIVYRSRSFPNYSFYTTYEDRSFEFLDQEFNTDDTGKVSVVKTLEKDDFLGNAEMRIVALATLEDKSVVQGMRNDVVILNPYNVGVMVGKYFAKVGEEVRIGIVAVDSDDNLTNGIIVKARVIKVQWVGYQEVGVSERLERRARRVENVVFEREGIVVGRANISFVPKEPGYYRTEVSYKVKGKEITTINHFYVVGSGFYWYADDDKLTKVELDKDYYEIGETANLLILSPFKSAVAIITVEREDIHRIMVTEVKDGMKLVPIKVDKEFAPNMFISVILHSAREGTNTVVNGVDIYKPDFRIGYAEMEVYDPDKKMEIEIRTSRDTYEPRQEVRGVIVAKDGKGKPIEEGEVVIAVVDEGVLNLVNYALPDPFYTFHSRRELAVTTTDMRRAIYGQKYLEEKGEIIGGDGVDVKEVMKNGANGVGSIGEQRREGIRKELRGTAYYEAKVKIEKGIANFKFTLPDNLTTFKIMVVGYTKDDKFGYGEKDILVSKPLMVISSFPRFVRIGDEVKGSVLVFNQCGKHGNVEVFVKPEGPFKFDYTLTNLFLRDRESTEVLFSFRVGSVPFGEHEYSVVVGAKLGEYHDSLKIELPVYAPIAYSVVGFSGRAEESFESKISLKDIAYPEFSKIYLSVSPSAFSELRGSIDYLVRYPYGCLEQKLSQVFPLVFAEEIIIKRNLLEYKTREELRKVVQAFVDEIPKYYVDGKGFYYWQGSRYADPYVTVYTMLFLTKAKEAGYRVNERIYSSVLEVLKSYISGKVEGVETDGIYTQHYFNLVVAISYYVLAVNRSFDIASLKGFYYSVRGASVSVLAYVLRTIAKYPLFEGKREMINEIRDQFTRRIIESQDYAYFDGGNWGYFYYNNVIVTSIVLQSLLEVGVKSDVFHKIVKWLSLQCKYNGAWYNTHENAMALWALTEYLKVYESGKPNFSVKALVNTYEVFSVAFRDFTDPSMSKEVRFEPRISSTFVDGKVESLKLELLKEGKGNMYFSVRYYYLPSRSVDSENGFRISKRILDFNTLREVKEDVFVRGRKYIVEITIDTLGKPKSFVVLDDQLPAGFEPVLFYSEYNGEYNVGEGEFWWRRFRLERYKDRVLAFAQYLPSGVFTVRYVVSATTVGKFSVPQTKVEEMYNPDTVTTKSFYRYVRIEDRN
ncbi:MAG: MG2 domain-containing protein [Brevinematia bacterium]